jgi:hypothetical protein
MNYRLPATLLSLALLAACGEEPVAEPSDNDGRSAEGEVIGGTISDAMLPLDTVRSQAPSAAAAAASDAASGEPPGAAPAPGAVADDAEPAPAAADPEPEPEADEDDA